MASTGGGADFEEEEEAREERMRRRKRSCCDDEDGREVLAPTLTPSHVEDDEAPLLLLLLLATSGLYHRSFFGAARVSLRRTVRRFRRCRIHGFHRGRSRFFFKISFNFIFDLPIKLIVLRPSTIPSGFVPHHDTAVRKRRRRERRG